MVLTNLSLFADVLCSIFGVGARAIDCIIIQNVCEGMQRTLEVIVNICWERNECFQLVCVHKLTDQTSVR